MMSNVLELIGGQKTLYGAVVGLVLGLFIGWWLLGVVLFPVDWENAAPVDLHPTYRKEVVRAIADAYSVHGNAELAKALLSERWETEDLRIALKIPGHVKVLPCVATDKESVKNVLVELFYSVLEEMDAAGIQD